VSANRSSEKTEIVSSLSSRAAWLVFLAFVAGVVALGASAGVHPIPTLAGVALSVVTVGSVVVALRFYPWFWYLCWLVPFVPLCLFIFIWEEPIRVGAISIISVTFAYLLAFALALGFLIVARERIRQWVQ
jgi:hypothetical protein